MFFHGPVPEGNHLLEFSGGVDVEEGKRGLFRGEGLQGEMEHDGTVLADGVEHDRLFTFRRYFPHDVD